MCGTQRYQIPRALQGRVTNEFIGHCERSIARRKILSKAWGNMTEMLEVRFGIAELISRLSSMGHKVRIGSVHGKGREKLEIE